MKILIVHNYYGKIFPSGEDIVVNQEIRLLIQEGHQVERFVCYMDDFLSSAVKMALGAVLLPWNEPMRRKLIRTIKSFNPDIIHVHNTHPFISSAVFHVKGRFKYVQTLHNYKMFCMNGVLLRAGNICERCPREKFPFSGILFRCYSSRFLKSLGAGLSIGFHHWAGTWRDRVDAYICLTEFQKKKFLSWGIPESKLFVKPHFMWKDESRLPVSWELRKNRIVFVGRISQEKGVRTLIKAWKRKALSDYELWIVGDGPMREELAHFAEGIPGIRWCGLLPHDEVQNIISCSKLLVAPSICYETFGMTVLEALFAGTPILVSDLGSLPEFLDGGKTGWSFRCGDSEDLARKMAEAVLDPEIKQKSQNARHLFETRFEAQKNVKLLENIYRSLIGEIH